MLIFSKALLFLWAEAVTTACYTQNRSLIRKRHNKTPYELLHDRKPLKYLHVFGVLCYPTNDNEDLGKLKPKADIEFDEVTIMASKQFSSGPELQLMTPGSISSRLEQNPSSPTPYPPSSVVSRVLHAVAPIPVDTTGTPLSTSIDQDAPSASTSPTTQETLSSVTDQGVEE
ncbi:retrovirus-related pol polyprotein from transposon TNT 1-94, partial [Tanacetum coccineum]